MFVVQDGFSALVSRYLIRMFRAIFGFKRVGKRHNTKWFSDESSKTLKWQKARTIYTETSGKRV